MIDGMPHAWPGGTTDPRYAGFTDPNAPSGAEASWAFFERYRRSDTAMPCATDQEHTSASPPAPPDPPTAERADGAGGRGGEAAGSDGLAEVDDGPTSTGNPARAGSDPSALPATGAGVAGWASALALVAAMLLRAAGRRPCP